MVVQGHQNFAATKASIGEADAAIGQAPRDMLETEHHLVKIIEDAGYEDFGFVLFRTDFTSESRWERFVEKWDVFLDIQFYEALPDTGLQEKVFTKIVSDECMSGMESENVALRRLCCNLVNNNPPGYCWPGVTIVPNQVTVAVSRSFIH